MGRHCTGTVVVVVQYVSWSCHLCEQKQDGAAEQHVMMSVVMGILDLELFVDDQNQATTARPPAVTSPPAAAAAAAADDDDGGGGGHGGGGGGGSGSGCGGGGGGGDVRGPGGGDGGGVHGATDKPVLFELRQSLETERSNRQQNDRHRQNGHGTSGRRAFRVLEQKPDGAPQLCL